MNIQSEWKRVRQLMYRLNKKYESNFTMDYVFGAPTVDRLGNLYHIRSVSDLENYLRAHNISTPKAPKAESIEMGNMYKHMQRLPAQMTMDFTKYLRELSGVLDEPIVLKYIRNIYSLMDMTYRYKDNGYNSNALPAIKSETTDLINEMANNEDYDTAESIRQLYIKYIEPWENSLMDYFGE